MGTSDTGHESGATRLPAVVHVDLDGASAIYAVHGWRYSSDADLLYESGLSNTLEFLDCVGVRATLFVIAQDLDDARKRQLLGEAVKHGHEIASHSLTHRKLTTLDRDGKRREIFASRERLATELGVDVRGFRAPEFDIDHESLELVHAAGYAYDSSVFPDARFARKVGAQALGAAPHQPLANRPLVELPLPRHRPLPVPFHPSYSLVLGTWYFRAGLRRFRRTRAPLVLLFHLTDLADPLPEERLRGRMSRLYTLSSLTSEAKRRRCERMLELVRREYRVVDTPQLLAMYASGWRDRLRVAAQ